MKILRVVFLTVPLVLAVLLLSPGCGDGTDAGCEDAFCIGLLLPSEESDYYDFGKPLIRSAELARDDINRAGGNVRLILRNSDDPLPAATEFLEAGVHGIVGPDWSGGVLEIFDLLVNNGMVAVSPSATSVTLTEKNKELSSAGKQIFFFRTTATDNFQAKILADQVQGEVLIVHRDDDYGRNLAKLINENLEDTGRSEATVVEYAHDAADSDEEARGAVGRIEALGGIDTIDSIIIIAFEEGGKIIKGMLDSQVVPSSAQYYVSDGLASANLYKHVDETNPGVVAGFKAVSPTGLPNPPERKSEFESRFDSNEFPSFQFTTHTYDAVVAMALASLSAESMDPSQYVAEMANVTRGGATPCISYAQCAAALTDETTANDDINYEGLSGPIEFDENGDIEIGFYLVYTYDSTGKRDRRIFRIPELEDVTPGQMP